MRTLIYSVFFDMTVPARYAPADLDAMFDLWAKHLRGSGRYDGKILIVSNRPSFSYPGVETVRIDTRYERIPDAQIGRVLNHPLVPSGEYDSILYLDLDILAVGEIHPLFARDERMWVSPSNIRTLAPEHAWSIMGTSDKLRYGILLPRRKQEMGVSSCVFSTTGATWTRHMSTWAGLITEHLRNHPPPILAEQGYLNVAYLKRLIPMKVHPRDKILHRDWTMNGSPILWHFPGCPDRPNFMKRYSLVSQES